MGARIPRTIPLKEVLTQDRMDGCDSFGGKRMAVIQLREGTCINCKPKIYTRALSFPLARTQKTAWMKNMQRVRGSIIYIHILAYKVALFGDLLAYEAALFGDLLAYEAALFGDLLAYEAAVLGISWPTKRPFWGGCFCSYYG